MLSLIPVRRFALGLIAIALAVPVFVSGWQAPGAGIRQDRPREITAVESGAVGAVDVEIARAMNAGELRLRTTEFDAILGGRAHQRYDQYHRGVRVFGGQMVRQREGSHTVSAFGTLYASLDIDPTPVLAPRDAEVAASRLAGTGAATTAAPELLVTGRDGGGFALAYRVRLATDDDITIYFIDARTGALVSRYSDLQTDVGTGVGVHGDQKKLVTTLSSGVYRAWDQMRPASLYTLDLKGDLARATSFVNGAITLGLADTASSTDNTWTDAAAVDAHAYSGWTFDYFYKRFGLSGLNGKNLTIKSVVHPVDRANWKQVSSGTLNLYYLNAFYAGNGVMVYGEGLPPDVTMSGFKWHYFSAALDVVGHELTHGVTDYSSNLIYRNESGALNESFSDIMGTSVEFFFQQVGAGYLKADYTVGEDLTSPMSGFRSMANPAAFGDPDHYAKRYLGTADNGGVHTNSGISNHAFYLAVEGGTDRTSGLSVTGVGSAAREKIEKVFFRAYTQLLPAGATFSLARAATIQAARDLYGAGSDVDRAVTQAWTAVGVS